MFLLDTGALSITMTHRGARRLGVEALGGFYDIAGIGGTSVGGSARLSGASLAGIALPEQTVTLLADTSIAGTGGADGILGIRDLARYEWDMDLPAGRIGLYAGTPCRDERRPVPTGMVDVRASWTSRPALEQQDPRSHLRLRLDGRETVAVIDTGAQSSFLFRHAAASVGVGEAELARAPTIRTRGFGPAPVASPVWRFAAVEIGGRVLRDVPMNVVEINDTNFVTFYEVGLGLGMDYLGRHRVWLAHASRMVLVPGHVGGGVP